MANQMRFIFVIGIGIFYFAASNLYMHNKIPAAHQLLLHQSGGDSIHML